MLENVFTANVYDKFIDKNSNNKQPTALQLGEPAPELKKPGF